MSSSRTSYLRLLCSFALVALLTSATGCTQLAALFGPKAAADTGEEYVEDDVEQITDEPDVEVQDIVDVPDSKKTDIKKDTKDADTGPDVQEDLTDEDVPVDDVEDVDDATDMTDVIEDIDVGIDAKDVGSDIDVGVDVDVAIDTGVTVVGCKLDADCGAVPTNSCAAKFLCLIDPINQTGTCVASLPAENGTACSDGNQCTLNDVCNDGSCVGTLKDCEDGNPCTNDSCLPTATPAKMCKHESTIGATPCTDGDSCTVGDKCVSGVCKAGVTNICDCQADADCKVQDSANVCEGKHICQNNACILDLATVTPPCADLGLPCQLNLCDPTTGQCAPVPRSNAAPCTDNNLCTFPDLCQDGACTSTPLQCNDGNPCTDDSCTPGKDIAAGAGCKYTPNAAPCEDGDACTGDGICAGGACSKGALNPALCGCSVDADCASYNSKCTGTFHCNNTKCEVDKATIVTCSPAANTACQTNVCDEASGECTFSYTTSGTICNDGNVCTTGDHCDGFGKCAKTAAFNCTDGDDCTNDFCLPAVGCIHPYNQLACTDGNDCTTGDKCTLGKCIGSAFDATGQLVCQCGSNADCAYLDKNKCQAPHVCSTTNSCTLAGSVPPDPCANEVKSPCKVYACNPATGACDKPNKADGITCSDNNWCTQGDACLVGACTGKLNTCDDGNDCTTDAACDPAAGTQGCDSHVPVDDGNACTLSDKCQLSTTCIAGKCTGKAPNCDDANPCTADSCDPAVGCKHVPAASGTVCSDGNPCTGEDKKLGDGSVNIGEDVCFSGKCVAGTAKVCKVPNAGPCYTSSCDPKSGNTLDTLTNKYACIQFTNSNPCQGGDQCIIGQSCLSGVCQGGSLKVCEDANTCTADSCESKPLDPLIQPGSCIHSPLTAELCNDGNQCTTKDVCNGSTCTGKQLSFDDGNPCTLDSCDIVNGPTHVNNPNGDCGPLAKCNDETPPMCVFASKPILISEYFDGMPKDASDDWLEIHNPTDIDVPIPSYSIEVAEAKPAAGTGWTTLATTDANATLSAHGYLLFAHSATVVGGQSADVVAPALDFHKAAQSDEKGVAMFDPFGVALTITVGQIRLRDGVTGLVQDRLCLVASGCTDLGVDVTPLTLAKSSANSYERKASETSTADSMAYHHAEWLAGNDQTFGANPNDNFIVRLTPDPQTKKSGVYEPACGGNCAAVGGLPTLCNFKAGAESCVADLACAIGCGSGKTCNKDVQMCLANQPGILFSEVLPGGAANDKEQFVEIYNATALPVDVSGFLIQRKDAATAYTDPWTPLYQLPAGLTLPSHRYFTIATPAYASTAGGVDVIVNDTLGLSPAGSALRLWDPRTDVELDTVGWGGALSYTNASNALYKAAPQPTPGNSIERKTIDADFSDTMKPGGLHGLAGNAYDTDADDKDWFEQDVVGPQSFASGQFEPACGGMCSLGLVCPFTGTDGGKCADPQCGGLCNIQTSTSGGGFACNVALATPACDLTGLVIAEVSPTGPASTTPTNAPLTAASNEYIALYNRANQDIVLDNLYITYRASTAGNMLKATDADLTKKPLTGVIHAHSYYLIVPSTYDGKMAGPDFVAGLTWGLDPTIGTVRINRLDSAGQALVLDRLSWGGNPQIWVFGEGTGAAGCADTTSPCAIRRLPAAGVTADDVTSLFSPWYYAGAGWDTGSNKDNFVTTATRAPHNTCLKTTGGCSGVSSVPQKP